MERNKKIGRGQKGQSTVEFLMTFIFAVGFIFLFIQLALNMTAGYMAHYAVYMASRTYLVMDDGSNSPLGAHTYAVTTAKEVFNSFKLKRFLINSDKFGINGLNDFTERQKKLYVGAYFTFRQRLSGLPMVGGNKEALMVSESFLGKEPSRHICRKRICEIMQAKNSPVSISYPDGGCEMPSGHYKHVTLFDDGC